MTLLETTKSTLIAALQHIEYHTKHCYCKAPCPCPNDMIMHNLDVVEIEKLKQLNRVKILATLVLIACFLGLSLIHI